VWYFDARNVRKRKFDREVRQTEEKRKQEEEAKKKEEKDKMAAKIEEEKVIFPFIADVTTINNHD
jgi:hypothetical protein